MRIGRPKPLVRRSTVSVVVPCYNYGKYLPDCVASIDANPGVDLEIIVVDDCSTDDSLTVARGIAASDPRVRVIAHETNKRHIRTYNDGFAAATGEYVVLLSADDLLTPGSLERSVALFQHEPEVGLVYGLPRYFTDRLDTHTDPRRWTPSWSTWAGEQWLRIIARRGRNLIVSPEAVVRRDVLERIGGYDEGHPHAADLKFWVEAARLAGVGRVNGYEQALYRIHDANMHSTMFAGVFTDYAHVTEVFSEVFADRPDLRQRSLRSVALEALRFPLHAEVDRRVAEAEQIERLVQEADPSVMDGASWRWFESRRAPVRGVLGRRLHREVHDLRWRVRSRRWQAFGV